MEELREQLQGKIRMADLGVPADSGFCVFVGPEPGGHGDDDDDEDGTYFPEYDDANHLSPIQERSEPSTSSDGCGGAGGEQRFRSASCHEVGTASERCRSPADGGEGGAAGRSQTYPRSHADETVAEYNRRQYPSMAADRRGYGGYPLEPREIDPDMFFQLHTADSQDELQEFLLLESQCGDGGGGGLHAAFVDKPRK